MLSEGNSESENLRLRREKGFVQRGGIARAWIRSSSGIPSSIAASSRPHKADHAVAVGVLKLPLDPARFFVTSAGHDWAFRMIRTGAVTAVVAEEDHKPIIKDGFHSECSLRGAFQDRTEAAQYHHNGFRRRVLQSRFRNHSHAQKLSD